MATTPKSSISKLFLAGLPLLALLSLATLSLSADARRPRKDKADDDTEVVAPAPSPKAKSIPLFEGLLPIGLGPLPKGLANPTAMACAGCHFESHTSWADSAHATGWRSPSLVEAMDVARTPACMACHLPLIEQSPELVTYDAKSVDKPVSSPNPAFQASLRLEGVTCAACHVRDGKVVTSRPPDEVGKAPHALAYSADLGSSEGCAACHQLTWKGAKTALYDTYEEWRRSDYAKAGIQCQDCHGGAGAGRTSGYDHATPAGSSRAVSVLADLPTLTLVRGQEVPVPLKITLQNTGAGHAFPTGSPFSAVRLVAKLVGPEEKKGKGPFETEPFVHDLKREISPAAPWEVTMDSRLPAGGQIELATSLSIPHNAPEGEWFLRIELVRTVRGEVTDTPPLVRQDHPLVVE